MPAIPVQQGDTGPRSSHRGTTVRLKFLPFLYLFTYYVIA